MAEMDAAADSSLVTPTVAESINDLPKEILAKILSNLPQKDLVLCREVCSKWRDIIDQHCPMKETIDLEEDDEFLSRKVELRMTSCVLSYFQKTNPSISLSHPETIKTFKFCDRERYDFACKYMKYSMNDGNARGLLLQIAPFVEHLELAPIYFNNNILPGSQQFPKLRELHIGHREYTMHVNLEILSSYQFPLLDSLYLCLRYSNETLMDEAYVMCFNFLANHKETLKRLQMDINFSARCTLLCDLPDSSLESDLSKNVKTILSERQLQLESLELSLPPKYFHTWTPIISSQKKLIQLNLGHNYGGCEDPVGLQISGISPGILSSASSLRTVILALSPVTCDGLDWNLLDLSLFRNAANLTELELRRRGSCYRQKDHGGIRRPNENERPWIINLDEINATSLKSLDIGGFVCNSGEMQILVDNSPVLERLILFNVLAPRTSEKYAESGVHGGIVKSFVENKSKKYIRLEDSLNYEHAEQNEKMNEVKKLYPHQYDSNKSFKRYFH